MGFLGILIMKKGEKYLTLLVSLHKYTYCEVYEVNISKT